MLTVATLLSLLLYFRPFSVASAGSTVQLSHWEPPTSRTTFSGDTFTAVTGTLITVLPTFTLQEADLFVPSVEMAVIMAVPSATAVTTPSSLTVATFLSLDSNFSCCVAFAGRTVAFSLMVVPSSSFTSDMSSATLATLGSTLTVALP